MRQLAVVRVIWPLDTQHDVRPDASEQRVPRAERQAFPCTNHRAISSLSQQFAGSCRRAYHARQGRTVDCPSIASHALPCSGNYGVELVPVKSILVAQKTVRSSSKLQVRSNLQRVTATRLRVPGHLPGGGIGLQVEDPSGWNPSSNKSVVHSSRRCAVAWASGYL